MVTMKRIRVTLVVAAAVSAAVATALSILVAVKTPARHRPEGGVALPGATPTIPELAPAEPKPVFVAGGRGPGGGRGRPGALPERLERGKLLEQFDKNRDNRLDATERKAAYEFAAQYQKGGKGGGAGKAGKKGETLEPPRPGPKLAPKDVPAFTNAPLYDAATFRTFFLEFEDAAWEKEMVAFHRTGVDIPATLSVDGKTYPQVGVHFHGASSFDKMGDGQKRSLVLSLDLAQPDQRLYGHRKLNLLNAHEDPSFLRTVLALHVSRQYIPAPKANLARVVINGECWGVYVNAQHFDKDFLKESFGTTKGTRWKVWGGQGGGLTYLGEDPAAYKRTYEMKGDDDPKAWTSLVRLCRVLNQTPTNELQEALAPLLDIDGTLKFLALENVLMNKDGYWTKGSDHHIYLDDKGVFHMVPYDVNESFFARGGPGGGKGGGPKGGGKQGSAGAPGGSLVGLDPFVADNDARRPLLSRLPLVPSLRARYLGYIRDITVQWLDWNKLGPLAQQYQTLVDAEVKADTRKLYSHEQFLKAFTDEPGPAALPGPGTAISLKTFVEKRRAFLLSHAEIKKLDAKLSPGIVPGARLAPL
jgi:hypothetical protein